VIDREYDGTGFSQVLPYEQYCKHLGRPLSFGLGIRDPNMTLHQCYYPSCSLSFRLVEQVEAHFRTEHPECPLCGAKEVDHPRLLEHIKQWRYGCISVRNPFEPPRICNDTRSRAPTAAFSAQLPIAPRLCFKTICKNVISYVNIVEPASPIRRRTRST